MTATPTLADGLHLIVKRDCPTCVLIEPVIAQLAATSQPLTVYTQDDPSFPESVDAVDDGNLSISWHHQIETVPTLLRFEAGSETDRIVGWERSQWETFTDQQDLAPEIAGYAPGCGSLSVDPDIVDELAFRFGASPLRQRRVEFADAEDDVEAMYERGWTDGLPVVAPTEARVLRMLEGTSRDPQEIVAIIPPLLEPATVEQVAINAVMAGCKPEYFPVVLAAVEAACTDQFNIHGLLCTLWFSGPVVIVNGPIRHEIGLNSGKNALGQGTRANATIGRALQLVIRNLGGGKPGDDGIDRSALGAPSKVGWCFAEDEENLPDGWPSLAVERGFAPTDSTVTLFRRTRTQRRCRSDVTHTRGPDPFARGATDRHRASASTKRSHAGHDSRTSTGVRRCRMVEATLSRRTRPAACHRPIGCPPRDSRRHRTKPAPVCQSSAPDSLMIVRAGGDAGAFSAIIEGWIGGRMGSEPITHKIER